MGQFHVRTQDELKAALSQAEGGDSILLAPNARFDKIELYRKGFDSTVTIASADLARPAKVLALNLNGTANLTIDGVVFDHTGAMGQPFRVFNSEDVVIKNSFFDGHIGSSGYGSGLGLYVNHSSGITVENNTFKSFNNGTGIHNTKDVVVRGNEIIDIRNDGMTFSGLKGALIEGNDFHSPRSPSDAGLHKDGIQFWTTNSTASEHVIIRGNTFVSTDDRQTIFISNEAARGSSPAKPHKDFLIEDNVVRGVATHGISVEHGSGIVIRNNLLEPAHGAPDEVHRNTVPLINVSHSSANVTITGNTVAAVQKEVRSSWTIEDNDLTTGKSFWHWSGSSSVPRVSEGPSETYLAWTDEAPAPAVPVTAPVVENPAPVAPPEPVEPSEPVDAVSDEVVFAVNAGGGRVVGTDGVVYEADRAGNWTGSKTYTDGSYSGDRALAGGDYTGTGVANGDDLPYATERYGGSSTPITFTRTDLDPGDYLLTLKFAEIYDPNAAAGKRVFDVLVNGKRVVDDLDLAKTAGPSRAHDVEVPVTIGADGKLTVSGVASRDNAKFSAIVLREADAENFRFNTATATSAPEAETGTASFAVAKATASGVSDPAPAGEIDLVLTADATSFRTVDAFDLG